MTEQQKQALDKLTVYLAQRDHSPLELRTKLAKRFELEDINFALNEANERGWMKPPEELSEQVARQLHEKCKGIVYINNYLKKKGLPEVYSDEDTEMQKALLLKESKLKGQSPKDYDDKTHLYFA